MSYWSRLDANNQPEETINFDPKGCYPAQFVWVETSTKPDAWTVWNGTAFVAAAPIAPTLADRLAALAAERYARQTAGVLFQASGASAPSRAASDANSTAMMTSSFVAAQSGHWVDGTPWKMADGTFVALKAADMEALALAVLAYVAACFAREAQLAAALAADLTTDITQGWPSNAAPASSTATSSTASASTSPGASSAATSGSTASAPASS